MRLISKADISWQLIHFNTNNNDEDDNDDDDDYNDHNYTLSSRLISSLMCAEYSARRIYTAQLPHCDTMR